VGRDGSTAHYQQLNYGAMKRLSSRSSVYTPISTLNTNLLHRLNKNDTSLVRIIFSSRNLGSQGVNILTQSLLSNTNLRELDLSSNSIGLEGVHYVTSLLRHQATSNNNMIANSNISDEKWGITTLKLCDNSLYDIGTKEIANALENDDILLSDLWLDDNFVGATALAHLANALRRNSKLRRLHLRHNSFQSLSPLIRCTFDKRTLDTVAESNHTLHHVFLNCGYDYECRELESMLKINRIYGKVEARRKKVALFLDEDLGRLLRMDMNVMDAKLLPRLLGILAQHGSVSTLFGVVQHLPSNVLAYQGIDERNSSLHDSMDVGVPMDVEYVSF